MGCDGGTIPTRGEMVRTKKKPEQVLERKKMVFSHFSPVDMIYQHGNMMVKGKKARLTYINP